MLFTSVRPGAAGSRLAGLGTSRRPRRPQSRLSARAGNGRGMEEVDPRFIKVAQKAADAAGQVARKYFRYSPAMASIDLELKEDQSPVTIADREAEQAMRGVIENAFPEHTIYGEEFGAHLPGRESGTEEANLVWVLDPIDGTKSFITGKPLFGTLVSLVKDGVPILGVIDQPVTGERWVGVRGKTTTFNGKNISVRDCESLGDAYLYATSPDMFQGSTALSFEHLCTKVRTPLYGCDCYAYGLLSMGFCDIVCEADMKPFDYMALVPIVEGAGGKITDWNGKSFHHFDLSNVAATEVLAAGDANMHKQALKALNYEEQRHSDVAQVM
mmetsp:Transcript_6132/g.15804  ORF Transcript_6132/g.15804 Transcript_6132/m.15804 type:complete len:328 (-) Transcript_6132:177-1160(-)